MLIKRADHAMQNVTTKLPLGHGFDDIPGKPGSEHEFKFKFLRAPHLEVAVSTAQPYA